MCGRQERGGRGEEGAVWGVLRRGVKSLRGWGEPFLHTPTPDVPLSVILLMRRRMTPAATSGAHNGQAGWCRQGSIMDADPHWEGQTKYKGWDDWSECYTLLRRGVWGERERRCSNYSSHQEDCDRFQENIDICTIIILH